jgi:hypothetical protein
MATLSAQLMPGGRAAPWVGAKHTLQEREGGRGRPEDTPLFRRPPGARGAGLVEEALPALRLPIGLGQCRSGGALVAGRGRAGGQARACLVGVESEGRRVLSPIDFDRWPTL